MRWSQMEYQVILSRHRGRTDLCRSHSMHSCSVLLDTGRAWSDDGRIYQEPSLPQQSRQTIALAMQCRTFLQTFSCETPNSYRRFGGWDSGYTAVREWRLHSCWTYEVGRPGSHILDRLVCLVSIALRFYALESFAAFHISVLP